MNIPEKWFFKGTKESEKQAKNSNYYKYFHNNFGTSYGFFKNINDKLIEFLFIKD